MVRTRRGNIAAKRRKKYLTLARGYVGSNSRLSTFACEQVIQSLNYAYIGRKLKKRNFRRIWIHRINAAARILNKNYSRFLGALHFKNIFLNRKTLAFLAFNDASSFRCIEQFSTT